MNTAPLIQHILKQLQTALIGKPTPVRQSLVCLLAGGHLLIEDIPGVGKTTLAHALARSLGLEFSRVQFTADLMPSDLTGVSVYDRSGESFVFHPGPIFSQVLLADEINRSNPKTQSALLEAMEEKQVSVDGQTYALPQPFFVIATQNPREQSGTYPLPESQLDRFLMRITLGYPDRQAERQLLTHPGHRQTAKSLPSVLQAEQLQQLQQTVQHVHCSDPLLDYVQELITTTRSGQWFEQGLSPRAGMGLLQAARAQALVHGRDYVAPDDVRAVASACIAHRLTPVSDAGCGAVEQVQAMLQQTTLH